MFSPVCPVPCCVWPCLYGGWALLPWWQYYQYAALPWPVPTNPHILVSSLLTQGRGDSESIRRDYHYLFIHIAGPLWRESTCHRLIISQRGKRGTKSKGNFLCNDILTGIPTSIMFCRWRHIIWLNPKCIDVWGRLIRHVA